MRTIVVGLLLLASSATAGEKDLVYQGDWVTTNRKLDGTMTCVVTGVGDDRWRGHFYGSWQGREFSYKVSFTGPPEKLRGQAVIDGANYEWTGEMTGGRFKGKFTGDRYLGSFSLKQKDR